MITGVPQNRIRIYIVGFLEAQYQKAFQLPKPIKNKIRFSDILFDTKTTAITSQIDSHKTLPNDVKLGRNMSLSNSKGFNDYFLFNDLRNGHSTIHSWDIIETTEHQKHICYLLLKNRRKSAYGNLDGNPLSLNHFRNLDKSITLLDLTNLVTLNILKEEEYTYSVLKNIKN